MIIFLQNNLKASLLIIGNSIKANWQKSNSIQYKPDHILTKSQFLLFQKQTTIIIIQLLALYFR